MFFRACSRLYRIIRRCHVNTYNFPFFDGSCEISVEDNCVEPLYKHLVNIRHPSMVFIGVPYYVCAFSMFDLQVRYYIRSMNGSFKLPSREKMMEDWEEEKRDRAARGYTKRQAHMMGPDQAGYYESISMESGTAPLLPVFTKIHNDSSQKFLDNLTHYRMDAYRIVDNNNFVCFTRK